MIGGIIIWYFFGKTTLIVYTILTFLFATKIYYSSLKFYQPNMKSRDNQHFHDKYPELIKLDVNHLSYLKIYFSTFSFTFLRLGLATLITIIIYFSLRFKFGLKPNEKKISDDYKSVRSITRLVWGIMWCVGITTMIEEKLECEKVYKKYLGEDYTFPEKYTTVIANHTSWVDILYFLAKETPSFISKASVKNYWLIGYIATMIRSVYLDRTNSKERSEILDKIITVQNQIMNNEYNGSMGLYPEGSTTNGSSLINFQRGAFAALTPVKPYLSKHPENSIRLSTGIMQMSSHLFLVISNITNVGKFYELPVIQPTKFLFENYKNLGKNEAEIYMEATRRILAEAGGLKLSDMKFTTKFEYLSQIKGKEIKNT